MLAHHNHEDPGTNVANAPLWYSSVFAIRERDCGGTVSEINLGTGFASGAGFTSAGINLGAGFTEVRREVA